MKFEPPTHSPQAQASRASPCRRTARALLASTAATFLMGLAGAAAGVPVIGFNGTAVDIPDSDANGVTSTIQIAQSGLIESMLPVLSLEHTFVGDLVVTLSRGGTTIRLMDQPSGGADANLAPLTPINFSAGPDHAPDPAESMGAGCGTLESVGSANCPQTWFLPEDSFAPFIGTDVAGDWVLRVSDRVSLDTGRLLNWGLNFQVTRTSNVSEPGTLALIAIALMAVTTLRRRGVRPGAHRTWHDRA